MSKVLITVAIPARNRPEMLYQSLESVLNQTYKDMRIVVLDNDSEVDIKSVVESFKDERVEYIRNKENLGIIGNWNKAVEICKTKYLSIFHDDDVMEPTFIEKAVNVLEANSSAALSYCYANKVDPDLKYISLWSNLVPHSGLISGQEYIDYTIEKGCCITIAPTVVVRKSVYDDIGLYKDEICFNSFDFNMWLRIANKYDIYFIDDILVKYRIHEEQMSQTYWWSDKKAKGRLATMLELLKVIALELGKGISSEKRLFLSDKVQEYNKLASEYARILVERL